MMAFIPITIYILFIYRFEHIDSVSLIQNIALVAFATGLIFGCLLPIFFFYWGHLQRVTKKRPMVQIFIVSVTSLIMFGLSKPTHIEQDSSLILLGILYIISFNLAYPSLGELYRKLNIWPEEAKIRMFNNYPPEHVRDFDKPDGEMWLLILGMAILPSAIYYLLSI